MSHTPVIEADESSVAASASMPARREVLQWSAASLVVNRGACITYAATAIRGAMGCDPRKSSRTAPPLKFAFDRRSENPCLTVVGGSLPIRSKYWKQRITVRREGRA